jgi:hypothetical protein
MTSHLSDVFWREAERSHRYRARPTGRQTAEDDQVLRFACGHDLAGVSRKDDLKFGPGTHRLFEIPHQPVLQLRVQVRFRLFQQQGCVKLLGEQRVVQRSLILFRVCEFCAALLLGSVVLRSCIRHLRDSIVSVIRFRASGLRCIFVAPRSRMVRQVWDGREDDSDLEEVRITQALDLQPMRQVTVLP